MSKKVSSCSTHKQNLLVERLPRERMYAVDRDKVEPVIRLQCGMKLSSDATTIHISPSIVVPCQSCHHTSPGRSYHYPHISQATTPTHGRSYPPHLHGLHSVEHGGGLARARRPRHVEGEVRRRRHRRAHTRGQLQHLRVAADQLWVRKRW